MDKRSIAMGGEFELLLFGMGTSMGKGEDPDELDDMLGEGEEDGVTDDVADDRGDRKVLEEGKIKAISPLGNRVGTS